MINTPAILIIIGAIFFLAGGVWKAVIDSDPWFAAASFFLFLVNCIIWLR